MREARDYAEAIIGTNDEGDFDKAWRYVEHAIGLLHTKEGKLEEIAEKQRGDLN
jgi:hypothetical protein